MTDRRRLRDQQPSPASPDAAATHAATTGDLRQRVRNVLTARSTTSPGCRTPRTPPRSRPSRGDLTDIHQATLAATRAQVTMELVSAVRNKGIDAFNQIMNMQA